MIDQGNILEISGVSKSFPGVKALDGITFSVKRGSVHALVGENGAGKSTLIKILAGIYHNDTGTIEFDGEKLLLKSPFDAQLKGIGIVHQEIKLSNTLTVVENIFLGNLRFKYRGRYFVDWKAMRSQARKMLDELKMYDVDEDATVETLSISKQQVVEICKTLNLRGKLLIMDEPSASLTEKELEVLFGIIGNLRDKGVTVIYISHRMDEIFRLADFVTVLRDGKHIFTGPLCEVTREKLIAMMVNRNLDDSFPKARVRLGEEVLRAEGLTNSRIRDVSFSLRRGEILGISGLMGAGRTELARAILGIDPIRAGSITLMGKRVVHRRFSDAIRNGLGLVPEDRRGQGIIGIAPVKENICLVNIDATIRSGLVNPGLEEKFAREYIDKLRIVTPSVDAEMQYLSGGNQQKVVIAKWLFRDCEVFILDEPTRGIDIGAKFEIYQLMSKMVESGKSIIMISSELPELLGMADRVLVMNSGRIVGEFDRGKATQKDILALCV